MIALAAAALLTALLGRRLAGELGPGLAAAAAFAASPAVRRLAAADPSLGWAAALWPALLLAFYAESAAPTEGAARQWRAGQAALLAALGLCDPRAAIAAGALAWALIAGGWLMAGRRRWSDWSPVVTGWSQACLGGVLLYAPVWWLRHNSAALPAPGAALPAGADASALLAPGPHYLGLAAAALAAAGAGLSRSYRGPARLWAAAAFLLSWLTLGPAFLWRGRYLWWAPALGRLFLHLPWLRGVGAPLWAALGALALGLAAAFGVGALAARLPLRGRRWAGAALSAAAAGAVLLDLARS